MTLVRPFLLSLALVAAGSGLAGAQPAPAAPAPVEAAPAAAPADPNAAAYVSPLREQCAAEIDKDPGWRADITTRFELRAHEQAAAKIQRNERHVFIAYAVIWILVAGLVGLMWLRQGRLNGEIARLEAELRRIERDEAAPGLRPGMKPAPRTDT